MRYLYVGKVVDTLDFGGKEVYLIPESEIELPDEVFEYPYFKKLILEGILKAVSPALQEASK